MGPVDQACGACGATFTAWSIMLLNGKPVCQGCVLKASGMTPKEALVRQATSLALRERKGQAAPFACASFLARIRRQGDIHDALPEIESVMRYVAENGKAPPMLQERTA